MTKKAPHKKPSSYKTVSYKTPSYNRPYQVAPDLEGGDDEYYYTTKELSGLLSLATSTLSGYRCLSRKLSPLFLSSSLKLSYFFIPSWFVFSIWIQANAFRQ